MSMERHAAAALTLALGFAPTAAADLTGDVGALVDANVTGGTTGFRLRRGDGVVLASRNPDYVAYPASCIKVAIHLHAMRVVEEPNQIHLNTLVPVYPVGDESCNDNHAGDTQILEPLSTVLQLMMEMSDNDRTNAAIDFFGLNSINITMHNVVGMSNATAIVNKFGSPCGGSGQNPANSFTLRDIHRIYERVAAGEIFALEQTRDDFYDLMLDSRAWIYDLIDSEVPVGLDPGDLATFKAGVELARKDGSWNTGSGLMYRTHAGWLKLPAPPCPAGGGDRHYAFSVFFDQVTAIAPNFDTKDVIDAMLRAEVRQALEAWRDCLDPGMTISCLGFGCPCGNDNPTGGGGCVNSTGGSALLLGSGTTSVGSDGLVLTTTGCPPGNTGLYFMGGSTFPPVAVGDGLGCTGGLFRFFPGAVDATGTFVLRNVASNAPPGMIQPGDTRIFQSWTRDVLCGPPPMPCPSPCGMNSNLSNSFIVVFQP